MKSQIVAGSGLRFRITRGREIRKRIEAKYAEELAKSNVPQRLALRAKIEAEILETLRHDAPSPYALYAAR